jgi:hypothetical protein
VAADPQLQRLLAETVENEELSRSLVRLRDPAASPDSLAALRAEFRAHPKRQALQRYVDALLSDPRKPRVSSWLVCDAAGTQLAGAFASGDPRPTIGKNYAYRTYCHGGPADLDESERPLPGKRISHTHLSALLLSTATGTWKVAVSTPVYRDGDVEGEFLGVAALTLEVGDFMKFEGSKRQFAVLADGRQGSRTGAILQHPLFSTMIQRYGHLPPRFSNYRVVLKQQLQGKSQRYRDPLGQDVEGADYNKDWIAAQACVFLESERDGDNGERAGLDTGLIVLVQEDWEAAIGPVHRLGSRLLREGARALAGVLCVVLALWAFVLRATGSTGRVRGRNQSCPT